MLISHWQIVQTKSPRKSNTKLDTITTPQDKKKKPKCNKSKIKNRERDEKNEEDG